MGFLIDIIDVANEPNILQTMEWKIIQQKKYIMKTNDKFNSGYYIAKLKKDGTYCVVFYPTNTDVGTIKKVIDTLIFTPSSNVEFSIKCLHDILNIVYMIKDNTLPELP